MRSDGCPAWGGWGRKMTVHTDPLVVGELIVQNGKQRGTRIPLQATVTMIGSANLCDVKVTGTGVAEVHCAISVTGAGPTLRSWDSQQTRVNGSPTSAGLLKHGDEIQVGPCVFHLEWHVEELIPLQIAAQPNRVISSRNPVESDALRDIAQRERALHEQESELATLLDSRQQQLAGLLYELAEQREELRGFRARERARLAGDSAKITHGKIQIDRMRKATREDSVRARKLYGRFLKRLKTKTATEREVLSTERANVAADRQRLTEEAARIAAQQAQFQADADDYKHRLHDAWELLTESQRRLHTDRQEAEDTLARHQHVLVQRESELVQFEHDHEAKRQELEARVVALFDEIARLEMRAGQSRVVVQQLEDQRMEMESHSGHTTPMGATLTIIPGFDDRVALNSNAKQDAQELLTELALRDRELDRERLSLQSARTELERRAVDLHDQRSVVAEQVAAIEVARRMWQSTECQTVHEIEALARNLDQREMAIEEKVHQFVTVEKAHRERAVDMWNLRRKLEAWQLSLSAQEATTLANRDRSEAELHAKREHLQQWETTLTDLCRKWSATRKLELWQLKNELELWETSRNRYRLAQAELDQLRERFIVTTSQVAEAAVATQHLQDELTTGPRGPLATRRLRVLRRHWERHFTHLRMDIDLRREKLSHETAKADNRYRELSQQLTQTIEQRNALADAEQAVAVESVTKSREVNEQVTVLSIEVARAQRTEQELFAVRSEVQRLMNLVMNNVTEIEDEPVILRLPNRAA